MKTHGRNEGPVRAAFLVDLDDDPFTGQCRRPSLATNGAKALTLCISPRWFRRAFAGHPTKHVEQLKSVRQEYSEEVVRNECREKLRSSKDDFAQRAFMKKI